MEEIIVQNLETNISRLIDSLESTNKELSEKEERTKKEIIESIKAIKIEPTDLSSIVGGIKSIVSEIVQLKDKEIPCKDDEIIDCLKCIENDLKEIEYPEFDTTSIEAGLDVVTKAIQSLKFPEQKDIQFPNAYPLPEDQLEALRTKHDEELRDKLDKVIDALLDLRSVSGGGGGPDVVGLKAIISGKETRISPATEETLSKLVGFQIPVYDYISLGYTGSNLTTVVYKTGGSGGTTVATLTLGYSGSTLTSITKT